jgi:NAD(P)-dependent dehydrogenase (short-subunit alcohol dehydrogenase family)
VDDAGHGQSNDPADGRVTPDLSGRTVVVTGASAGIGAAAARRFAQRNATVAVVGRSREKTTAVAAEIGARAHLVDYGSLADVRRLAAELCAAYERIDVLANNAGAAFTRRRTSADGHEMTFQVNHLAPFLLTGLLLDRLAVAGGRVVSTASTLYRKAHLDLDDLDGTRRRYRTLRAYGAAKLATVLFTRELARRASGTGVTATAFHPGGIATEITRDSALHLIVKSPVGRLSRLVLLSPDQGAEPLLHLATVADPQSVNGGYFHRLSREEPANDQARDPGVAALLWQRSVDLTRP